LQYVLIVLAAAYLIFSGKFQFFTGVVKHKLEGKADSRITWIEDYDEAAKLARRTNRPLFVLITAPDWCVYCQSLDATTLQNTELARLIGSDYIALKITDTNPAKSKFKFSSYPTILLLSPQAREIRRFAGYTTASALLPAMKGK